MIGLFLLAVSLSLDALGVGVTYSARGIVVPWREKCVIGFICGITTGGALICGKVLELFINPEFLEWIGSLVIIAMGIRLLIHNLKEEKAVSYDRNRSLRIEVKEAVMLGLLLSVDSVSAGIAIGMTSMECLWLPVMVGGLNAAMIGLAGIVPNCGKYSDKIAGVILVLIGLSRLILP